MTAFEYPETRHERRHGPVYGSIESYRDWLRDEFTFRCVYCLFRERWGRVSGEFDIEHWMAQVNDPGRGLDYGNLFYACHTCNVLKGTAPVPDPGHTLTAGQLSLDTITGAIMGLTPEAEEVIDVLGLDSDRYREWRLIWIRNVELADDDQYHRLMQFPLDLPDLSTKEPDDNTRQEGVQQSWFARKERGELQETY